MGQRYLEDSIGSLTYSAGLVQLASSRITLGGQQYRTNLLTLSVSGLVVSSKYNLFAALSSGVPILVASQNSASVGPNGYTAFKFLTEFFTSNTGTFGSYRSAVIDPSPVGSIAESMLTEAQFQALNGTGWVLADGRSVVGSMYAMATGFTTIPDLRGVFRRGKNNGRADGNQDPAGERSLGAFQGYTTALPTVTSFNTGLAGAHRHFVMNRNGAGAVQAETGTIDGNTAKHLLTAATTGGSYDYTLFASDAEPNIGTTDQSTTHNHTVGGGDTETRVRNVAVNVFFKINMV